jgi:hypothetical protein
MILSSNVDLDLNGCALQEAAADNQAIGVLIDHQQNVTIRNGKTQAFQQAIVFDDHMGRNTTNVSEHQRTSTSANVSWCSLTFADVHCSSRDALEIGAVLSVLSTNRSKS